MSNESRPDVTPNWGRLSLWHVCFKWVETTNYIVIHSCFNKKQMRYVVYKWFFCLRFITITPVVFFATVFLDNELRSVRLDYSTAAQGFDITRQMLEVQTICWLFVRNWMVPGHSTTIRTHVSFIFKGLGFMTHIFRAEHYHVSWLWGPKVGGFEYNYIPYGGKRSIFLPIFCHWVQTPT